MTANRHVSRNRRLASCGVKEETVMVTYPSWRHEHVDEVPVVHKRDQRNSISSTLGLTSYEGRPAAVVESTKAKDQISALVDLIQLQTIEGEGPQEDSLVTVALLLDRPHPEAVAALETLTEALGGRL